jgi:hypothetical protein
MEVLWEDLRAHTEEASVPEWQKELLDARRKAVEDGREAILDWDQVKGSPGTSRR